MAGANGSWPRNRHRRVATSRPSTGHLPARSIVRIYTSNGELVRELVQDPNANRGGETGELAWDLKNGQGRNVVSGIYIYQVESPQGHNIKGHFVIIR